MDHVPFPVFPDDELLDLRLFRCGWGQCAPLHSFCPIVRNHYLFYYVISGYGSLEPKTKKGATQRYDLESGQGFLISPGQMNICKADQAQPWKYVWLEFDGLHVAEYLQAAGLSAAQPVYQPLSIEQARKVQEFMLYITGHPGASSLRLIGHLCLFLDALIQTKPTRQESCGIQPMDFYVQEAISYMERNYQRELTVEEIAGVCQLPHDHFSKLFQEKKRCPPQEYLIRMRLSRAAELMKSTTMSIGDISASCGYPNQPQFSRAFKQRYGVSPRKWRNQNKAFRKS